MMRLRLAQLATGSTLVMMLALSPALVAQQDNPAAPGTRTQNPTAGRDTNQATSETQTIRGVIAGVTAEGEAMFDFRTNRAVAAEATYLTVVGSPPKGEASDASRREPGDEVRRETASDDRNASHRRRHNVYYIWLSPRTKVCEDSSDHGQATTAKGNESSAQKKEVAVDNLEVGDHVEIQFASNESWNSSHPAHQTDQMTRKHGRHRTYYGQATSVTILASKDMSSTKPDATERTNREIQK
jgi:hypothetical protein